MIWFYRFLFIPAFILAFPYYALRMLRRGGYSKDFSHRFGGQKRLPAAAVGKCRIWLQAVSVGEIEALSTLIDTLSKDARIELVVTTTTSTAYKILREKYADKCFYTGVFPLDFWLCSRRAWNKLNPDICLLMEGELWPEHMHQAKIRGAKLLLLNARMSDKSFARYAKIPYFARRLLDKFAAICASSEFDAGRFVRLGASPLESVLHGQHEVRLETFGFFGRRRQTRIAGGNGIRQRFLRASRFFHLGGRGGNACRGHEKNPRKKNRLPTSSCPPPCRTARADKTIDCRLSTLPAKRVQTGARKYRCLFGGHDGRVEDSYANCRLGFCRQKPAAKCRRANSDRLRRAECADCLRAEYDKF